MARIGGRKGGPESNSLFTSLRRRHGPRNRVLPILLSVLGVVLIGGWVVWYRLHSARSAAATARSTSAPVDSLGASAAAAPDSAAVELPELGRSDSLVRHLAQGLSSQPRVAGWLVNKDLVRRFVVAVANVANGESPKPRLEFMAPKGPFEVTKPAEPTRVDPASYHRYDALTTAFVSLSPDGIAQLYHRIRPLCDQAYRELGLTGTFEEALARAFGRLLAVEVPGSPPEVVPHGALYAYANPRLESLSPAAKQLLRMGPVNARRIQSKLRDLARAMGVQPITPGGDEGPAGAPGDTTGRN